MPTSCRHAGTCLCRFLCGTSIKLDRCNSKAPCTPYLPYLSTIPNPVWRIVHISTISAYSLYTDFCTESIARRRGYSGFLWLRGIAHLSKIVSGQISTQLPRLVLVGNPTPARTTYCSTYKTHVFQLLTRRADQHSSLLLKAPHRITPKKARTWHRKTPQRLHWS